MEKKYFIYPADKAFRIIRIMDFNCAEPTRYRTHFHCAISGQQNGAFWYIVLRIMLLTYSRAMIRFSNCDGVCRMLRAITPKRPSPQRANMFQKARYMIRFMKNIVCRIISGGEQNP